MTEKPCEIQCFDKGVDLESKFGGWVRTLPQVEISPVSFPYFLIGAPGRLLTSGRKAPNARVRVFSFSCAVPLIVALSTTLRVRSSTAYARSPLLSRIPWSRMSLVLCTGMPGTGCMRSAPSHERTALSHTLGSNGRRVFHRTPRR